jgi:hypothetical protein
MQTFLVMREDGRPVSESLFIKDGFFGWAFLLAPFWLAWRQLWVALGIYGAIVALISLLMAFGLGGGDAFLMILAIHAYVGLEAGDMWRAALAHRGFTQSAVVAGDVVEDAELRFLSEQKEKAAASAPGAPGAPQGADGP